MNIEKVVERIQSEMNIDWVSPKLQEHVGKDYMTEYLTLVVEEYADIQKKEYNKQYKGHKPKIVDDVPFNYYCPT